jgi:hypothetical protein
VVSASIVLLKISPPTLAAHAQFRNRCRALNAIPTIPGYAAGMRHRIHSIDAIRGFCLLNIFINHVAVGVLQQVSPSRIFLSDSAEAFVFLAGVSCFLAYGRRTSGALATVGTARMWGRAGTLFLVNLMIMALSAAILVGDRVLSEPALPALSPEGLVAAHGLPVYLWHVLTMQQPIGFSVVLRLYVVLLLIGPAYVWLAAKRFWYPLLPAGTIWLLSGQFGWAESESLTGVPMMLTVLPWNLVFAGGIALGAAIVQRQALPATRLLKFAALGLVLAGPFAFVVLTRFSTDVLYWVDHRNDAFWTGASKSLQSPLRVLYMFALAYVFIAWRNAPVVRLVHQVGANNLLCRLGRRSLAVFASGAVLALASNQLLWIAIVCGVLARGSGPALVAELALTAGSFAAMLWFAGLAERRALRSRGAAGGVESEAQRDAGRQALPGFAAADT